MRNIWLFKYTNWPFQALDEQLEELLKMVMRTQVYIHYPDMGML